MLKEMAVADAYAIAWEFTDAQTAQNDLKAFYQHPTYLELKPGQYTDDTQRAIANIKVLNGPRDLKVLLNPLSYAESYVDTYKRDPREGYSRGFQALLNSVDNGLQLITTVDRKRPSNGAVMGVAPLGFIQDIKELKLAATAQAISTHNPVTAVHAQIVALATHFFVYKVDYKASLLEFVDAYADWSSQADRVKWLGELTAFAMDGTRKTTIQASSISAYMVHVVNAANTLTDIIIDAVRRGGDTDSAAATPVAIASLCPDIENDIPQHLYGALDTANPEYGIDFLDDLERDLREWYLP